MAGSTANVSAVARREAGVRIGSVFGIAIRLHPSVVLIAALIFVSLGQSVFPHWHPEWSGATTWSTAAVATVLFFASLLSHELAHAVVARRRGLAVPRITLFIFGGVSELASEPADARSEFVIAIVGPLTSLAIGLLFALVGAWLAPGDFVERASADPGAAIGGLSPVATICVWLAPVNVVLAVFNLVPGFPLDGGRVLRAALWWWSGDQLRATQLAANCGRAFSWLLIAWGFVNLAWGRAIEGVWFMVIGWFLGKAAASGYQQLMVRRALHGLAVADLMRTRFETVDAGLGLGEFVDARLLRSAQTLWPVVDGSRTVGVIAQRDVAASAEAERASLTVRDAMRKLDAVSVLSPRMSGPEALERVAEMSDEPLPVVESDAVVGLLHAADIFRWLELHRLRALH